MKYSKEQIGFIKNASDHVNVLCGGRGYGKTHQLIKEMEDKINKLENENQQLKEMQCPFLGTGCKRELEQLKKQKDDVIEYIKNETEELENKIDDYAISKYVKKDLLRMLGEIDD